MPSSFPIVFRVDPISLHESIFVFFFLFFSFFPFRATACLPACLQHSGQFVHPRQEPSRSSADESCGVGAPSSIRGTSALYVSSSFVLLNVFSLVYLSVCLCTCLPVCIYLSVYVCTCLPARIYLSSVCERAFAEWLPPFCIGCSSVLL